MADKKSRSNCRSCSRTTNHAVLFELTHGPDNDFYDEKHTWQVLRCLGCETVGFRYRFDDFDNVEELPDGSTRHSTTFVRYPNAISDHRPLEYLYHVPDLISKVYRQTVTAYAGDALILAGIGLRATIEAVCNHLDISGSSLEKRIDQLAKAGHISSNDRGRLHAIRFLGNDAAHEIRQPKRHELRIALEIIEHLINSVFILGARAKNLDVTVETYETFLSLLEDCLRKLKSDQPLSLVGILGRGKRRVGALLDAFELKLVEDIKLEKIGYLEAGAEQDVEGKKVRLYSFAKEKLPEEDLPF